MPNLFLAFIFLRCKKINALKVFVNQFPNVRKSLCLPTHIGNRAFVISVDAIIYSVYSQKTNAFRAKIKAFPLGYVPDKGCLADFGKRAKPFEEDSVPNKGSFLRRSKSPFVERSFSPPQTPPLFAKPFLGIYLFALQKDKCP